MAGVADPWSSGGVSPISHGRLGQVERDGQGRFRCEWAAQVERKTGELGVSMSNKQTNPLHFMLSSPWSMIHQFKGRVAVSN